MKQPPDSWWISFMYDATHDFVEASFRDVVLETDEDVLCWRREVEKRFQRYGRPVDLLINLEGLIVKPTAARFFGAQRAEVLAEHTRVSYRYNGNPQTRTSIYTSSVIHGADANIYDSREEALKALLAHRDAGAAPLRAPVGTPLSQRAPSQRTPPASAPFTQRHLQTHPPPPPPPGASGALSQRYGSSASGPATLRSPPSSVVPPSVSPHSSPSSVPPAPPPPSTRPPPPPVTPPPSPALPSGPPSLRPSTKR